MSERLGTEAPAAERSSAHSNPVVLVEDLWVTTTNGEGIVRGVSLSLRRGEILGIVGESGSGKTSLALALLGYARPGARLARGAVSVDGVDVIGKPEKELRKVRGRVISYVPQDPATALNPSRRVADQIEAVLVDHREARNDRGSLGKKSSELMARVGLPMSQEFRRRYPHQLSGGQQQRVAIAMALACSPAVVVFDEPTTALDVIVQAMVLEEIQRLRSEHDIGMVYVSHDLAVVARISDRIGVMYGGLLVETATKNELLAHPRHPYSRALLSAIPDFDDPQRLEGIRGKAPALSKHLVKCPFVDRCQVSSERCSVAVPEEEEVGVDHTVRCFEWRDLKMPSLLRLTSARVSPTGRRRSTLLEVRDLDATYDARAGTVHACKNVSFSVGEDEAVAVVGASGSGKTTLARCIAGLHKHASGTVLFAGSPLPIALGDRNQQEKRLIQMVFQNPYDSLNPAHTVGSSMMRTGRIQRGLNRHEAVQVARHLTEMVGLDARILDRYPAELSGGERQRVAIARSLIAEPRLLICDEVTSALDVSVQAVVLDLLAEIKQRLGLTLLFVSHDLAVVAAMCDRVIILESGVVREEGTIEDVLRRPRESYTRELILAVPRVPRSVAGWNQKHSTEADGSSAGTEAGAAGS